MLALGFLIVVVIFILAPTLTLIVATRTRSFPECFSGETWQWLLGRRRDLRAFSAAMIGGVIFVARLPRPPLLLLAPLSIPIRLQPGVARSILEQTLPVRARPRA